MNSTKETDVIQSTDKRKKLNYEYEVEKKSIVKDINKENEYDNIKNKLNERDINSKKSSISKKYSQKQFKVELQNDIVKSKKRFSSNRKDNNNINLNNKYSSPQNINSVDKNDKKKLLSNRNSSKNLSKIENDIPVHNKEIKDLNINLNNISHNKNNNSNIINSSKRSEYYKKAHEE